MAINNKGQVMVYKLMVLTIIILMALILITPLKDVIMEVRGESHLNCSSEDLSFGQEATCLGVDILLFYFIGSIIIFGFVYYLDRRASEVG